MRKQIPAEKHAGKAEAHNEEEDEEKERGGTSRPSPVSAEGLSAIPGKSDQSERRERDGGRSIEMQDESDREDAENSDFKPVTAAEEEQGRPRKRPRRGNAPTRNYSETKRRKPQEPRPAWKAYMNSSKRAGRAARRDKLHKRIAWGQGTVDRIVQGRYEWHDGRLNKRLQRTRQTRVYDDGG